MKEIPLTQGRVAIVDDDVFEELSQWKWSALWSGWDWYAVRSSPRDENGRRHMVYMHRQIMNAQPGQQVDHEDGNGLNNQRHGPDGNLRFCTVTQNHANQKKRSGCSSIYKGVYWNKRSGKWLAQIKLHGKKRHLGYSLDEIDAALAYNEAATELFGEFARLNIVEEEI